MNQNLCNNCGGEYEYRHGRWVCRSCGSYKPEELSNEEVTLLYTAYQKLRLADFYEAETEFDDIIYKYPENPNAYWGRLMAKYGIKYEQDFDGRMIPTCYAASIENIMESEDYQQALRYADAESKSYYQRQAEYIERVRKEWIEKAKKEKPYDIFICYKDSDLANGIERTEDSVAAQELYLHLTGKGYRVFYSRETLRDKVGEKYEPYIFNALATAKVMLVYGSKPEYITSTWLKNEWTRYEKRLQKGEKKPNSLLVACDGFSPSELPTALSSMQCLNASEKNFYGDLDEAIANILHPKKSAAGYVEGGKKKAPTVAALLVLLAAIGGFLAWGFLSGELVRVQSVTDLKYGASVSAQSGGFKGRTELFVEDISDSGEWTSVIQNLHIETDGIVLYNMSLRRNGKAADWSGNITVSIPLPNGVSEKRVTVYDIGGAVPKKLTFEVSEGKIVFSTNQLSEYLIAKREHNIVIDAAVAPTCEETGLTAGEHCADCEEVLVAQTVIPALGHSKSSAATCTTAQICTVCNTVFEQAKGHKPGPAATCSTTQNCTVCNTKLADKIPHTPGAEATCTAPQKCTVCSTQLKAALGHTPGTDGNCTTPSACTVCGEPVAKPDVHIPGAEATCTAAQTCTLCNKELTAAKGHTPGAEATCTTPQICTVCNEVLKAASHTPGAEATCTTSQICMVCNEVLKEASHTPSSENTCTSPQICTLCNIELKPAGHTGDWIILTQATKTEDGLRTQACSVCGVRTDEVIPAKGSVGLEYYTNDVDGTCTIVGIGTCTDTNLIIPAKINGYKVSEIGFEAFMGCIALTSVTIPDGVTNIGSSAFRGCGALTNIIIPDSVIYIGDCAFEGCSSLTTIELPNSITSIASGLFMGCSSLTSITVPNNVTVIGGMAFFSCSDLTNIVIPNKVTSIGDSAFSDCSHLTDISIPDSVVSIGESAFSGCRNLSTIIIPDSVTTIGKYAFSSCNHLTSIVISAGLQHISDSMLDSCNDLTTVSISNGVTSIGNRAFAGCSNLKNIIIPDSVTSVGDYVFENCFALESISIPNGVTKLGKNSFFNCHNLKSITIPNSVTSIGDSAFSDCRTLTDIVIPNSVTSIGKNAFYGCCALTNINLPQGVTRIGDYTFYNCFKLTSITIPNSVTKIDDSAFAACSALTTLSYNGTMTQWNAINKNSYWIDASSVKQIICSDGTVSIG